MSKPEDSKPVIPASDTPDQAGQGKAPSPSPGDSVKTDDLKDVNPHAKIITVSLVLFAIVAVMIIIRKKIKAFIDKHREKKEEPKDV